MWPSYKKSVDKISDPDAKDFCPTNCHVNVMQASFCETYYEKLTLLFVCDKRFRVVKFLFLS